MINLNLTKSKAFFLSFFSVCQVLLCISCQSTKVYEQYESVVYEGSDIISECTKDFEEEKANKTVFSEYSGSGNLTVKTDSTRITVISEPDYKFIAYSFFLKPIIIAGSASVSLGKCTIISTALFFCAIIGYLPDWFTPLFDLREEKEALIEARLENKIEFYPEFHKPFTKNHIIMEKTLSETSAYKTNEEESIVLSYEKNEYDNSIYVSREIKKDYCSTVCVVKFIGAVITIPIVIVSIITGTIVRKLLIE